MSDPAITAVFAEHGRWISRFMIDGVPYGGSFDAVNDPRLDLFFAAFPTPESILELGSLEGGHTIGLGRRPGVKRVLGVEGRRTNLRRAQLAAKLLKAGNVEFIECDFGESRAARPGEF